MNTFVKSFYTGLLSCAFLLSGCGDGAPYQVSPADNNESENSSMTTLGQGQILDDGTVIAPGLVEDLAGRDNELAHQQSLMRFGLKVSSARFFENPDAPELGFVLLELADRRTYLHFAVGREADSAGFRLDGSAVREFTRDGVRDFIVAHGEIESSLVEGRSENGALLLKVRETLLALRAQAGALAPDQNWLIEDFAIVLDPEALAADGPQAASDFQSAAMLMRR